MSWVVVHSERLALNSLILSNAIKQISLMLSRILSLRVVPQSVTSCFFLITTERPISCELPAASYSRASSKAWRCIPDPEADKPRLDLACIRERECVCVYMCVSGVSWPSLSVPLVHYASLCTRPRLRSRPASLSAPWLSCDLADILIGTSEEW